MTSVRSSRWSSAVTAVPPSPARGSSGRAASVRVPPAASAATARRPTSVRAPRRRGRGPRGGRSRSGAGARAGTSTRPASLSARSCSETAPNETSGMARVDVAGGDLAVPHQPQDLAAAGRRDGGEDGGFEHAIYLDQTKMRVNRPSSSSCCVYAADEAARWPGRRLSARDTSAAIAGSIGASSRTKSPSAPRAARRRGRRRGCARRRGSARRR